MLYEVFSIVRRNFDTDTIFHNQLRKPGSNVPALLLYAIEKYRLENVRLLLSNGGACVTAGGQTPMEFLYNLSAEPAIEAERKEALHLALEIHDIATRNPSDLPETCVR
jgi:hypothetical protein